MQHADTRDETRIYKTMWKWDDETKVRFPRDADQQQSSQDEKQIPADNSQNMPQIARGRHSKWNRVIGQSSFTSSNDI